MVIGVLLIGTAFWTQHYHAWVGVTEDSLVGIGSSFLLAGALFFLERRFLTDVRDNVREVARETVTAEVTAQTSGMLSQVQEVQRRMDDLITQEHASRVAEVRAMDNPTYGNVARGLAAANRIGALATGRVTVQGSEDLQELGLEFSWGEDSGDSRFGDPGGRRLHIRGEVYDDWTREGLGGGRPSIELNWGPGESLEDVNGRLVQILQTADKWKGLSTLRLPQAIVNLQTALDWAMRSKWHGGDSDQLQGTFMDMINTDWVLTGAGLESPRYGFFFAEQNFPERKGYATFPAGQEPVELPKPIKPDGVDDDLWEFIILRAEAVFPIRHGPAIMTPLWRSLSDGPEEER